MLIPELQIIKNQLLERLSLDGSTSPNEIFAAFLAAENRVPIEGMTSWKDHLKHLEMEYLQECISFFSLDSDADWDIVGREYEIYVGKMIETDPNFSKEDWERAKAISELLQIFNKFTTHPEEILEFLYQRGFIN